MTRGGLLLVAIAVGLWPRGVGSAQDMTPLTLVTAFADGRVTEQAVSIDGLRAWTPFFPRVAGWRDEPGTLPITALNVRATLADTGLHVSLSVLRGPGKEVEEPVAQVVVPLDQTVVVDALRSVGLMPVRFSTTRFATPPLPSPVASSRTTGVLVEAADPTSDPVPTYRITVRNVSDTPVVSFTYDSAVQGRASVTGQRGDPSAVPLMAPGERYTFTLRVPSSTSHGQSFASGTALDAVQVSAVVWADGRAEGDPNRVTNMMAVHRGRLAALTPVVAVLQADARAGATPEETLRRLQSAITAIPSTIDALAVAATLQLLPRAAAAPEGWLKDAMAFGAQDARAHLLAELERQHTASGPTVSAQRALEDVRLACDAWLTRLRALFPTP